MCKAVVPIIKKLVDDGETDLPKLVNEACLMLSLNPPLHKFCVDELDDVIKAILTYLDAGLNGTQICVNIGWCAPSAAMMADAEMVVKKMPTVDVGCEICKFAVPIIRGLVEGGETDINVLLNGACNKTTGLTHTLCIDLLKPFVDEILKLIEMGLSNDAICAMIKLCKSADQVVVESAVKASPIECEICQFAVKEIAALIAGGETNLDALVTKACDKLPGPLHALAPVCVTMLEKVIQTIVTDLQNGATEKQICTKINLCTSAALFRSAMIGQLAK